MTLDWREGPLAQGLACYHQEEFFEAHEHWEQIWLGLKGPEKSFLQALIQMTAAFHHLNRGNSVGSISLLRRTLRRLESCPESFGGIRVTRLRSEVRDWIRALEAEDSMRRPGMVPRITPMD